MKSAVRKEGGEAEAGDGGNANLPIGGFKSAIQENGGPRDDSEKRTATGEGEMLHRQERLCH
jgi:hypothetical protein